MFVLTYIDCIADYVVISGIIDNHCLNFLFVIPLAIYFTPCNFLVEIKLSTGQINMFLLDRETGGHKKYLNE